MHRVIAAFVPLFLLSTALLRAQNETSLTRADVSVIKKKLVAVFDALGRPAGYGMEHENYNLPTDAYRNSSSGKYNLIGASAERRFGTEKQTEDASRDFQKEYQKKIAEAQAKGDYAEVAKLGQEMGQKAAQIQVKATESHKEPVEVSVRLNENPGAVIDPDAVLFERPGVIALKAAGDNGQERVSVYCDPVALRETKQLSRVDLKFPEGGVAGQTTVLSVAIEINGPAAEIEPWIKAADTQKILAQIDKGR